MFSNFKIALVAALLSTAAIGAEYQIKKGPGNKVEWTAVGNPGFLRITGENGYVEGVAHDDGTHAWGEFKVALADFDTGMGLRNRHMKEKYLEVEKHPHAILKLNKVRHGASFPWEGVLTLKGESHPVKGKGEYSGDKVKAEFTVDISKYPSIGVPSWLGVTMAEEVNVSLEFPLK